MRLIILICSLCLGTVVQSQGVLDRIVGQVGGEIILLSELNEVIAYSEASSGELTNDQECEILSNLISDKLLINQAILDSVVVTDAEIQSQLDARIDQIMNYMNNDINQFETYYGKSTSEVKAEMRKDLKNRLLSERMRMQVLSNVEATPQEVINYYNSLSADSIPYYNSEVELQELIIKPQIPSEQKEKIIKKLNDIRDKILSGAETFEVMARKHSDDPGSKRQGGMVGMMKRGALAQEYEAAAYNLDINEISEPVESEFGFHIIQLLERRGNNFSTRHILIKPEIEEVSIEESKKLLDSLRTVIAKDSLSFEQMVVKHGYENVQSYSYGGRIINPSTGNSFFEIGDIDPDIYFAIDTLEVGEITQPMIAKNQLGDTNVKIVKLVSLSDPHKASLEKDFSKIQELATEQKRVKEINKWLDNTAQNTFIDLDLPEKFNHCTHIYKWSEN